MEWKLRSRKIRAEGRKKGLKKQQWQKQEVESRSNVAAVKTIKI